ncbi:sulfotransferase family 2 domain-containing protein [Palleronia caenipelagi]|uniref:Sulfotransferase family protein n=1 Tax=Palleronia caenipelagi TaxID=2489174 RepID=A0A547Q7D0_9RHOB|nr:sulfotransferase family 2 domain-containing protein [Palleronia caenipelagi]TRD22284.1 sulfotransferase family protein [Palleronia caenipelagi]
MIISPQRGYVFVHIPKTGGTSLARALEERATKDDILIGDTPKARRRRQRVKQLRARGRLWKHSKLRDLDGLLSPDEIRAMQVVTIVRNPWDRMVSYFHWLQEQSFDHPAVRLAKTVPFDAFMRDPGTRASISADQVSDYLRLADGSEPPALILRCETLVEDLTKLEEVIGARLELPHVNRSDRPEEVAALYDDDLREIVAKAYAGDIARFGYAFPAE